MNDSSRASKSVTIHTDGACKGNPGPGGWGAVLQYGETRRTLKGGELATTNNRMELTAAIEALTALKQSCEVVLFTDSVYVMQGLTQWMPNWKARGWKTADKKPVKNVDLWQALEAAAEPHHVSWRWVKGHSDHVENARADALARGAIP